MISTPTQLNLLAYDPGMTTGVALIDGTCVEGPHAGEWGQDQFIDWCFMTIASRRWDVVIGERFIINDATLRTGREGQVSIELNGVVRQLCRRAHVTFIEQTASDAMSFMTDDKLRALGWHRPGFGHANDALRHLGLYMVKNKIVRANIFVTSL